MAGPYQRLSNGQSADSGAQAITTVVNAVEAGLEDAEATITAQAALIAGKAATAHTHTGTYDPAGSAASAQAAAVQRANHTGTQAASTISDFNTAVRTSRLDQMAAPTTAVGMGSQRITDLAAPSSANDAARKADVDAVTAGAAGRQTAANRVVFCGDSIMRYPGDTGGTLNNGRVITTCWPSITTITSSQRAWHIRNAAIGGDYSDTLVARFSADVLAESPGTVVIGIGTNDLTNTINGTPGFSYAEWKSNIASLVASTRTAGAVPVLCTIPPINTSVGSTWKAAVPKWNAWLRRYAASEGLAVIDVYKAVVDTSSGDWIAGADAGDGVHPSEYGCALIAVEAKLTMDALLPRAFPTVAADNSDAGNLLTNGLMVTDSGGTPTGWTATGTLSCATDTSFCAGRYVQIGSSEACSQSETVGGGSPTVSVGDRIAVSGRIRSTCAAPYTQTFQVTVTFVGSSGPVAIQPVAGVQGGLTGTFYQEYVVPASTTSITIALSASSGSGTVDFGQVGLFNLTAMGAV